MTEKEFEIRVFSLKDNMYGLALKMLQNPAESKDCVQEVLSKLWVKRNDLNEIENLKSYALKMTRNQCVDALRRKDNRFDELEDEWTEQPQTEQNIDLKNMKNQIQQWVNELPLKQRTVMYLRDFEHLEMEEIMGITQLEYSAVKTNLSRARKKIKDLIVKYYPEIQVEK